MLEGLPPDVDDPNLVAPQDLDKLERITAALRRVRELKLDLEDMETRRKAANNELNDLVFIRLPDMFKAAATTNIGLAPEGNMPGFMAVLKPYYKAVISAEWELERQTAGYTMLRTLNGGELIKNTIVIEFDKGDDDLVETFIDLANQWGMNHTRGQSVHWGTLTAWLREQYIKFKKDFTREQLEAIGAVVGHMVEVKQVK